MFGSPIQPSIAFGLNSPTLKPCLSSFLAEAGCERQTSRFGASTRPSKSIRSASGEVIFTRRSGSSEQESLCGLFPAEGDRQICLFPSSEVTYPLNCLGFGCWGFRCCYRPHNGKTGCSGRPPHEQPLFQYCEGRNSRLNPALAFKCGPEQAYQGKQKFQHPLPMAVTTTRESKIVIIIPP